MRVCKNCFIYATITFWDDTKIEIWHCTDYHCQNSMNNINILYGHQTRGVLY